MLNNIENIKNLLLWWPFIELSFILDKKIKINFLIETIKGFKEIDILELEENNEFWYYFKWYMSNSSKTFPYWLEI
jgi:hypothetical protein